MARLTVRVTPRARRNGVDGVDGEGVLHVRVSAAPADGEANDAATRVVARALGVAPSRVTIARGAGSRTKLLEVAGMDDTAVAAALTSIVADAP